jgi:hypothetical protein
MLFAVVYVSTEDLEIGDNTLILRVGGILNAC